MHILRNILIANKRKQQHSKDHDQPHHQTVARRAQSRKYPVPITDQRHSETAFPVLWVDTQSATALIGVKQSETS